MGRLEPRNVTPLGWISDGCVLLPFTHDPLSRRMREVLDAKE